MSGSKVGVYLTKQEKIFAGMVSVSIEQALLDVGLETLRQVELQLQAKYGHGLSESLIHPTHLKDVLSEQSPENLGKIVQSTKKYLEEFSNQKIILDFLKILED